MGREGPGVGILEMAKPILEWSPVRPVGPVEAGRRLRVVDPVQLRVARPGRRLRAVVAGAARAASGARPVERLRMEAKASGPAELTVAGPGRRLSGATTASGASDKRTKSRWSRCPSQCDTFWRACLPLGRRRRPRPSSRALVAARRPSTRRRSSQLKLPASAALASVATRSADVRSA